MSGGVGLPAPAVTAADRDAVGRTPPACAGIPARVRGSGAPPGTGRPGRGDHEPGCRDPVRPHRRFGRVVLLPVEHSVAAALAPGQRRRDRCRAGDLDGPGPGGGARTTRARLVLPARRRYPIPDRGRPPSGVAGPGARRCTAPDPAILRAASTQHTLALDTLTHGTLRCTPRAPHQTVRTEHTR